MTSAERGREPLLPHSDHEKFRKGVKGTHSFYTLPRHREEADARSAGPRIVDLRPKARIGGCFIREIATSSIPLTRDVLLARWPFWR